jgi:hypothetical protein
MAHNRIRIVLAACILAFVCCGGVSAPSTAQEFDRSAPRPAPAQKYKLSDDELRSMGVARGDVPAFPNKCYGSVSISNEFLAPFRARGFSLEAVCLAITSPWVQYNPETGKPLPVSKDFLFVVPDCFKSGTPFLDCEFNHDHASGLKRTDAGRQGVHTRAVEVDAAVRRIIASGRFGNQCACDSLRWQGSQLRIAAGAACRVDAAPACLEQMSGRQIRTGSLVFETEGIAFENVPTKGLTDYGGFDILPRLARGYAYRIGSPEGDDDTPYVTLPPGRKIEVGTQ